jgi:hypothetical protein
VVAAGVVPRRGAASLTGLTSGILAAFLGLGDFGALDTLLSYTMTGVGVDLGFWLMQAGPENLMAAKMQGLLKLDVKRHLGRICLAGQDCCEFVHEDVPHPPPQVFSWRQPLQNSGVCLR